MIEIKVNNNNYQFRESPNLILVLEQLDIAQNGIAVAVNQNIISKSDWEGTALSQNDEVLIITATQGG